MDETGSSEATNAADVGVCGGTHARALASHHGFVRNVARGLVAPNVVEDVAQDVLLAGLKRPPARVGAFKGWLVQTARNLAGKWHRGEQRRVRREEAAAQPEALPSAHELLERIELEQAVVRAVVSLREPQRSTILLRFYEGHSTAVIARQLGVPADTVRARLRRGLADLRTQLDAKFGGRTEWVAALVPIAALPTGGVGSGLVPGLAKGSVAVGATGAAVMAVKSVVAAAACAAAAIAWWSLPEKWIDGVFANGSVAAAPTVAHAGHDAPAAPLATPVSSEDSALAATRERDPSAAAVSEAAGDASLPPPGLIRGEVVDARTLAPLDGVKIRFLSDRRFAECECGGSVSVALTAARWEANVTATGYEPVRLGPFDLAEHETKDLGRVQLERGNGVIEGRVTALHLPASQTVLVELFGDGRSPCDRCLGLRSGNGESAGEGEGEGVSIGSDCGYRDDRNQFSILGGREFRFEHLAAGVYWLRACDPQQRIVEARRIEIGRGGRVWQELDVSAPTYARFELRHERAGIFSGAWAGVHEAKPAPIVYEFRRDGRVVGGVSVTPSKEDTLASVGPPVAIPGRAPSASDELLSELLQVEFTSAQVAFERIAYRDVSVRLGAQVLSYSIRHAAFDEIQTPEVLAEPGRLDREREEGDGLAFDRAAPDCDEVQLKIVALRPDMHEIRPLPRAELTVTVSCGHYRSDEVAIDLRNDPFQPFLITMRASAEPAAPLDEIHATAGSCITCHKPPNPPSEKEAQRLPLRNRARQFLDYSTLKRSGSLDAIFTIDEKQR